MSTQIASVAASRHKAERLKAQGNELHQQGQFRLAYSKYSEAINEDPMNAVYFANRAASSLALKEYLDAAADSNQATQLDPNYAKAWSRYATACSHLCSWTRSIKAWKHALACLPSEAQSSETETRLRAQFTAGLQKSVEGAAAPLFHEGSFVNVTADEMPWKKAQALEAEIAADGRMSSCFVILEAYQSFKSGVDAMKRLKQKRVGGRVGSVGDLSAIENISNGLMEDPRVFHLDCNDWMEKYNKQLMFESDITKAWEDGGANIVKKEALQRLEEEGWDKVRLPPAWIMCGFHATSCSNNAVALEYFSRATDVLKWGSQLWESVPRKDRGVIFEKTFIRGVSRMRVSAMRRYRAENSEGCTVTLEDIVDYCHEIIAEIKASFPASGKLDAATLGCFYMYPRAEALSTLGWCYTQRGLAATTASDAQTQFSEAASYYMQAAKGLPLDEELVAIYLNAALEAYWWMPDSKTVVETLALVSRIQESFAVYPKIWAHSPNARGRDAQIHHALNYGVECAIALQQRKIVGADIVKPKGIKSKDKWARPEVVYV